MSVNDMKKTFTGARFASISPASIKPSSITATTIETALAPPFFVDTSGTFQS